MTVSGANLVFSSTYGERLHITNVCLYLLHDTGGKLTALISPHRNLRIYATNDKRPLLEKHLHWAAPYGLIPPSASGTSGAPADMGNYGQAGSSSNYAGIVSAGLPMTPAQIEALRQAAELSQMLNGLEKVSVDDNSRRESLLDKLCSAEDVLKLPEHKNPPGIASGELLVDLLKHQVCPEGFCFCTY